MFYDEYGLTHSSPNEISENSPLFTAEELLLEEMLFEKNNLPTSKILRMVAVAHISHVWDHKEKRYKDRAGEAGYHFSHDNMLGVYTMARWARWLPKSGLTKQVTDPKRFIHPRDIMFFGLCEQRWWAIAAYPLVFLALFAMSVQSCLQPRMITSGKLLWFVRTRTLIGYNYPLARQWYTFLGTIMKKEHGEFPYVDIFRIYFPYENHPNNILARQIWH